MKNRSRQKLRKKLKTSRTEKKKWKPSIPEFMGPKEGSSKRHVHCANCIQKCSMFPHLYNSWITAHSYKAGHNRAIAKLSHGQSRKMAWGLLFKSLHLGYIGNKTVPASPAPPWSSGSVILQLALRKIRIYNPSYSGGQGMWATVQDMLGLESEIQG